MTPLITLFLLSEMSETSFLERVVGLDTTRGTLMKEVLPDKKKRILTSRYIGGQFALMNYYERK